MNGVQKTSDTTRMGRQSLSRSLLVPLLLPVPSKVHSRVKVDNPGRMHLFGARCLPLSLTELHPFGSKEPVSKASLGIKCVDRDSRSESTDIRKFQSELFDATLGTL